MASLKLIFVTDFDDKFSRWPKKVGFVQSPAQEDHLAEKHEVQTLLSDLETGWDNSTVRMKVDYRNPTQNRGKVMTNKSRKSIDISRGCSS